MSTLSCLGVRPAPGKQPLLYIFRICLAVQMRRILKHPQGFQNILDGHQTGGPFIAPHHSTPPLSMIGGGSPLFMGEISKAHSGILFLDEYLEFQYKVQEALREPIEKGEICISRKGNGMFFPARFMLVAATNLCPCGSYIPGENFSCSYSP